MERRELLAGLSAIATFALAGRAGADNHSQHTHHGHGSAGPNRGLVDAAGGCVRSGEICLNHCLDLLAKGEKEMAACGKAVNELLAACGALQKLAAVESRFLAKYATFAAEVCEHCEKECRKHEKRHQPCRDCAEACAACLKECRKIAQ